MLFQLQLLFIELKVHERKVFILSNLYSMQASYLNCSIRHYKLDNKKKILMNTTKKTKNISTTMEKVMCLRTGGCDEIENEVFMLLEM